jgi:hypothetical protein
MKKTMLFITFSLLAASAVAQAETNAVPDEAEANYANAIEGRTEDILKILSLDDTNKAAKVHITILAQYRALRAWHDENDPKLKSAAKDTNAVAQVQSSLKMLHEQFISKLSENLLPAQVDQVKDKMVYGKVQVTYNAYCEIIPNLTDVQKAKIMEFLKAAREEAMDCGSSKEKDAVFKKFKGRIANFLAKEGVDEQKARKEWGEKQKAKSTPEK